MRSMARSVLQRVLSRLRPPPSIATAEELGAFLQQRASLIAQKCAIDYCRGKTGLVSYALFSENTFLDALDICRWEAFAAVLGDLFILADSHLQAHARGEQRVQLVGAFERAAVRGVELLLPAAHLPLEEPLGPAEVGETHRERVHGVQRGERLDRAPGDRAGALRAERGELGGGAVRRPVHALHHVELRADHGLVLAQREGPGHGHGRVAQGRHHAVLPRHVVGGGEHVAQGRPADDPLLVPVADDVGEVRLAARDERPGQRAGHLARAGLLEELPEAVEVEAGEVVGHEPASSSFDCSLRIPASQRSVSVARSL